MKKTTLKANRRGFTLVEILMVLLILAILSGGIAFISSDNSSSVMANKVVNELRTMKAASIMYRRDHGMIAAGTPVSALKPYMGSSIENSEVSYSFFFGENGEVFLQADLSELDDKIKQRISDLADQNLYLNPGEESASLRENNPLLAQFTLKNALGYFTATPAYAGNGHGYGNGGKGNAHGRGWFDDWDDWDDFFDNHFGDDEEDEAEDEDDTNDVDGNDDDEYEDDLNEDDDDYDNDLDDDDVDEDDVDNEEDEDTENDSGEGEYETPDFSGGNNGENSEESGSQENSGSISGNVSSEGKYSGGDKLLIRI